MAVAVLEHPTARPKERGPLTQESLAHPARTSTSRTERGRRLWEEHGEEIRFDLQYGVWLVPSQSDGTSVYEVTLGLRPSCECRDFGYNGHREQCKHIYAARLAEAEGVREDLRVDFPIEEELLAACEYALEWFEAWDKHAPEECVFGRESAVMKRLKHAVQLARECS